MAAAEDEKSVSAEPATILEWDSHHHLVTKSPLSMSLALCLFCSSDTRGELIERGAPGSRCRSSQDSYELHIQ
ncbi:hypothetical protein NDU88_004475 [Pleurodeles waltl]|uniref:Uncharacterized protein n=1 Tax=Pleurodeles waltl TaxID=8319 RepID=A0AAV7V3P0_PLEWA|nr:hypothetical protein NDU88_004475 [Pleurodeles waltl]